MATAYYTRCVTNTGKNFWIL